MRSRGVEFILVGILSIGVLACHPPKPAAPERPPVEPPAGWRLARQEPRRNTYSATFVPKLRTSQEKIWITILRKPEFISKSTAELLEVFQPHFICQNRDLNILKKDPNELLFEEKDSVCYGQAYRYTIGRIARGKANVSYYAYRADLHELPVDHRDFVLKTLSSAPLDTTGSPPSEKAVPTSVGTSSGAAAH